MSNPHFRRVFVALAASAACGPHSSEFGASSSETSAALDIDGSGDANTTVGETSAEEGPAGRARLVYIDSSFADYFWWIGYEDGVIDGPRALAPRTMGYPVAASPCGRVVLIAAHSEHLGVLPTNPDQPSEVTFVNHESTIPQPASARPEDSAFTTESSGIVFSAGDLDWAALYYSRITSEGVGEILAILEPHPTDWRLEFLLAETRDRVVVRSDVDGDGSPETYATHAPADGPDDLIPLPGGAAELGQISADGSVYAFSEDGPSNERDLFVVWLDAGAPAVAIQVSTTPDSSPVGAFALAPDGRGIAFYGGVETDRRVFFASLTETGAGTPMPVGDLAAVPYAEELVWSSGSHWLGFMAQPSEPIPMWHLVRVQDAIPGPPTVTVGGYGYEFEPDESAAWQLSFDFDDGQTSNHRLWRIDLTGSAPAILGPVTDEDGQPIDVTSVSVSPSRRYRLLDERGASRSFILDDEKDPMVGETFVTANGDFPEVQTYWSRDERLAIVLRVNRGTCGDPSCFQHKFTGISSMAPGLEIPLLSSSASSGTLLPEP